MRPSWKREKIEDSYCTNCGAKVNISINNFCTNCGAKLVLKQRSASLSSFKEKIINQKQNILFSIAIIAVIVTGATITAFLGQRYLEYLRENSSGDNDDKEENGDVVIYEESWEIDSIKMVTNIIDGDTFDVNSSDRIRLADVDAPESGESGYEASRNYLISLILNKKVYLDIDDKYRTDPYGRLVAVIYIRHNETHLLNVNEKMLEEGHATIWNFDNQFNPYTWTLFVFYST